MKKLFLIILAVILPLAYANSQIEITKAEFDKLVDYANCKYTEAFIEKEQKNNPKDYKKYVSNIKPIFDTVNIGNSPNFANLKDLLEANGWNRSFNQVTDNIEGRKNKFEGKVMPLSKALILLSPNSDYLNPAYEKLTKTAENYFIKKEVEEKAKKAAEEKAKKAAEEKARKEAAGKAKSGRNKSENAKGTDDGNLDWLVITNSGLIILIILILLFLYFNRDRRTFDDKVEESFVGNERLRNFIRQEINKKLSDYKYELPQKERDAIIDAVLMCMNAGKNEVSAEKGISKIEKDEIATSPEKVSSQTILSAPVVAAPAPAPKYKYLKGRTGNSFSRLENTTDDSYFRIIDKGDDSAEFEFFGNEEQAIARRIFHEDISDVDGSYNGATQVETTERGIVERDGDSWNVTKRVKIKLS